MKQRIVTNKNVYIGDRILFKRQDKFIEGTVQIVREDSVIVEISKEDAADLGYNTNMTVVNHSNYVLINRKAEGEDLTF